MIGVSQVHRLFKKTDVAANQATDQININQHTQIIGTNLVKNRWFHLPVSVNNNKHSVELFIETLKLLKLSLNPELLKMFVLKM